MKKVLFVSNVLSHINAFHIPYLKWFHDNGYIVHVMTNANVGTIPEYCDKLYDIKIARSPFSAGNISALKKAKQIINSEKYNIVHCHTPMGGVVGRLASRDVRKNGTKVLYTAHGFHFFKGAPLYYWLVYYSVEKFLARFTDAIITINSEDYSLAKQKFKTDVYLIPGVGVDPLKFYRYSDEMRKHLRVQYGIDRYFNLIYAAEFIKRKDHRFLVECMPELIKKIPEINLIFAGSGELLNEIKQLAEKLGVSDHIMFLGFRKDIPNLYNAADVSVSASHQEGLALNVVESMMCGLPVVASSVRGNRDIVGNNKNGYLYCSGNRSSFICCIESLYNSPESYAEISRNAQKIVDTYGLDKSLQSMSNIYHKYIS